MGRNIETGGHEVVTRFCSNPTCEKEYVVQNGGQKSGGSPAIHVQIVGEAPKGYCSPECTAKANGWKEENPLQEFYRNMGINYEEIHPEGYLSPARRVSNSKGGD